MNNMNPIEKNLLAIQLEKETDALKQEIEALRAENHQLKKKTIHLLNYDTEIIPLKEIIAFMPGNIFWKNKKGQYLGCNNNMAKILGLTSPGEMVGKRLEDFLPLKDMSDLDALNQADQDIMNSREGKFLEEVGPSASGELAIYLSHKIPLFDQAGEAIGLLGISMDITQQKKLEEDLTIAKEKAETSNRAKSQFLAVINHELRTPLTCIMGLIEFLKQGRLSLYEEKKFINAIENSTQHLLSLVNDVLDFSRLETGKYNLHITPVNLRVIIQEVYHLLKPLAEKKELKLRIHPNSEIPKNLLTDARIIRHILINLVNNAIKFTEKGHIEVAVNSLQQKHHTKIEMKILDTGLGIPSDKLNLIFEPFQQLEDAYMRQSSRSGTGLGLTIVKKLAELIGCKMHVESESGKGSIFTLTGEFETQDQVLKANPLLPAKKKKQKNKIPKYKPSINTPVIFKQKPYVLLIEDDPTIKYIHKKMLLDLGCKVDVVSQGQEAIQALNQHHILFVDISLPDMSGFEVIKTIRKRYDPHQLPIVALTVYTGKEEKEAAFEAGSNAFASKPITQAYFKKILLRYVG